MSDHEEKQRVFKEKLRIHEEAEDYDAAFIHLLETLKRDYTDKALIDKVHFSYVNWDIGLAVERELVQALNQTNNPNNLIGLIRKDLADLIEVSANDPKSKVLQKRLERLEVACETYASLKMESNLSSDGLITMPSQIVEPKGDTGASSSYVDDSDYDSFEDGEDDELSVELPVSSGEYSRGSDELFHVTGEADALDREPLPLETSNNSTILVIAGVTVLAILALVFIMLSGSTDDPQPEPEQEEVEPQ